MTWHLVGWRVEGDRGQMSSPVVMLDPVARKALTRSGRMYELDERALLLRMVGEVGYFFLIGLRPCRVVRLRLDVGQAYPHALVEDECFQCMDAESFPGIDRSSHRQANHLVGAVSRSAKGKLQHAVIVNGNVPSAVAGREEPGTMCLLLGACLYRSAPEAVANAGDSGLQGVDARGLGHPKLDDEKSRAVIAGRWGSAPIQRQSAPEGGNQGKGLHAACSQRIRYKLPPMLWAATRVPAPEPSSAASPRSYRRLRPLRCR